jgi:hypothetical protein
MPAAFGDPRQELSSSFGGRGTSLLLVQKRSTQEKTTPRLALAGPPARQVREAGPGFSTGLLSGRKGVDLPVDSRCAACRPRLTAAQGPRVEQRAILARTFRNSLSTGKAAARKSSLAQLLALGRRATAYVQRQATQARRTVARRPIVAVGDRLPWGQSWRAVDLDISAGTQVT